MFYDSYEIARIAERTSCGPDWESVGEGIIVGGTTRGMCWDHVRSVFGVASLVWVTESACERRFVHGECLLLLTTS